MKYSLVLHAAGPSPSDFRIYLNNAEHAYDAKFQPQPSAWWKVGMLQSVLFKATAGEVLPYISTSLVGLTVASCESPDLDEGINIFLEGFVGVNDSAVATIGDIIVRKGTTPLGLIQRVEFEVDIKGIARLHIERCVSKAFWLVNNEHEHYKEGFSKLPTWISVSTQNLDELQEVGTIGVIDSINPPVEDQI